MTRASRSARFVCWPGKSNTWQSSVDHPSLIRTGVYSANQPSVSSSFTPIRWLLSISSVQTPLTCASSFRPNGGVSLTTDPDGDFFVENDCGSGATDLNGLRLYVETLASRRGSFNFESKFNRNPGAAGPLRRTRPRLEVFRVHSNSPPFSIF